jgi:orotate phosphoribosyltransferase
VEQSYGIPVISIIRLEQVLEYIQGHPVFAGHADNIAAYRVQYGV